MNNQFLMNKPVTVDYAFKKEGKGERHGTPAERRKLLCFLSSFSSFESLLTFLFFVLIVLAAQARKNNVLPPTGIVNGQAPPPPNAMYQRPPMMGGQGFGKLFL